MNKVRREYDWYIKFDKDTNIVYGNRIKIPQLTEEEETLKMLEEFWKDRSTEEKVAHIQYYIDTVHELAKEDGRHTYTIEGFSFIVNTQIVLITFNDSKLLETKDFMSIAKTIHNWTTKDAGRTNTQI